MKDRYIDSIWNDIQIIRSWKFQTSQLVPQLELSQGRQVCVRSGRCEIRQVGVRSGRSEIRQVGVGLGQSEI